MSHTAAEELAAREVCWYDDGRSLRQRRLPAARRGGVAVFLQLGGRTLRLALPGRWPPDRGCVPKASDTPHLLACGVPGVNF
ncbi:hypothetical protein [Pseudonocardia asaccharolytica]|uniref:hypothetical protein n=1 Tax=Pseudonocardia asaccharolytica TaxID=54010 RepID=UPI0011BD5FFA|nr:hypothetical protein [Pseudonocardia asaccharolytica]